MNANLDETTDEREEEYQSQVRGTFCNVLRIGIYSAHKIHSTLTIDTGRIQFLYTAYFLKTQWLVFWFVVDFLSRLKKCVNVVSSLKSYFLRKLIHSGA